MENVTFIIKTFERPKCVKRLVKSIYKKYPSAIIYVADDSTVSCKEYFVKKYPDKELVIFELEKDQGLSYGRNYLLDRIKTDYFVLLDDDYVFDAKTDIEKALTVLTDRNLDILGGYWRNFTTQEGLFSTLKLYLQYLLRFNYPVNYIGTIQFSDEDRILHADYKTKSFPLYADTDIVHNFFIAKTASVKRIGGWDGDLKLQEHTPFFFKAKLNGLKVGFSNEFSVLHKPMSNRKYRSYRSRNYTQTFMEMYDIKSIVSTYDNGDTVVIKNKRYN